MVRCASRFVGQAVFFDAGKPQGAGYAGGAAERVALIQGVESKQSGQGIAGDAAPKRSCAEGLLCFGDDAGNEQPQISIGAAMEGIALRDVPGDHIAVPVQIADDDQRGLRTVRGAQLLKQLFADLFKRVEIDDGTRLCRARPYTHCFVLKSKFCHFAHLFSPCRIQLR